MAERRGSFFTSKPPTATRSQIDRVSEMLKGDKKWFGALSAEQQNAVVAVMMRCLLSSLGRRVAPQRSLLSSVVRVTETVPAALHSRGTDAVLLTHVRRA